MHMCNPYILHLLMCWVFVSPFVQLMLNNLSRDGRLHHQQKQSGHPDVVPSVVEFIQIVDVIFSTKYLKMWLVFTKESFEVST